MCTSDTHQYRMCCLQGKGGKRANVVMSTGSGLLRARCCRVFRAELDSVLEIYPGSLTSCSSNIPQNLITSQCPLQVHTRMKFSREFLTPPLPSPTVPLSLKHLVSRAVYQTKKDEENPDSRRLEHVHVVPSENSPFGGLDAPPSTVSSRSRARRQVPMRDASKQQPQEKRVGHGRCMETHVHACSLHNLACSVRVFII